MYLFCSRLVPFLFSQNFSRVSHTFYIVCQKENGFLKTYLFQRKIENFTLPSTGHGRHIGEVDVKLCVKVKVKGSRYRPGVAQRVGRGIALLFCNHSTRRG